MGLYYWGENVILCAWYSKIFKIFKISNKKLLKVLNKERVLF